MHDRDEFEQQIILSIGERFSPLFLTPTFRKICVSLYDLLHWKKLELDYYEIRKIYLEDLQEWEYIKSNFAIEKPKTDKNFDRIKEMFLREREFLRSQL